MTWRAFIAVLPQVCVQGSLLATSCSAPPPPCAIIPAKGVWFMGVVADVATDSNDLYPTHVRFLVDESFAGLEPGVKEVTIAQAGGWVEKGLTYLVNARRLGDRLIVDTCTLTGLVSFRADYLDYLRRSAAGDVPSTATLIITLGDGYGGRPDAAVTVVGPDGEITARTDINGVAKLEGIKPGRYRFVYDGPRYRLLFMDEEVEAWAGSCPSLRMRLR